MKFAFADPNNFLEFNIENIGEQVVYAVIKGKVDFVSFCRGVELLNFKNFCVDFVEAYERLNGEVKLFDYVGNRFYIKMTFDKMGYVIVNLSVSDDDEINKVELKFYIEQSFLNEFYEQIKSVCN